MEGVSTSLKFVAAAALFLVGAGCDHEFHNPHLQARGLTEADIDPNAPPNKTEVKSRIIHDVRMNLELTSKLDQGSKEMPSELKLDPEKLNLVRADGKPLWKFYLKSDPQDRQGGVNESAYYDDDARVYFYHYEGGSPFQDIWFGPYKLTFWRKSVPGHDE